MLCERCGGQALQALSDRERRRAAGRVREATCERCGATILTLDGVLVGRGDATLARLARFGLASGGKPLLAPRRGKE